MINSIAEHSHGFVGADLQLLCSEAILAAVRRHFKYDQNNNSVSSDTQYMNDGSVDSSSSSSSTGGGGMKLDSRDLLEGLSKVKPSALREVFGINA